ncbi:MAG: hypothetical protein EBX40_01350 [Gammaproteobacteria bacterium]|nr:hypothetical protein [Gammaproteobacteria bacterium]
MSNAQNIYAHWRDSGRTPKFFIIDAKASLFILLLLLHIRLWTFLLTIAVLLFLACLEYYKLPLMVFLRVVCNAIVGKKKVIYF